MTQNNRDKKAQRLVIAVGHALADYFDEPRGNIACHLQAATILIEAGTLAGYEAKDFLEIHEFKK